MASVSVRIRYRPVRIGWCIRDNNWDDLRRALRFTHVFWGGKFNPLIPVAAACADELVRRFRVDVLVDAIDDQQIKTFLEKFSDLPWPLVQPALFSYSGRFVPNFLDVSHSLTKIADELRTPHSLANVEDLFAGPDASNPYALVHWDHDDPLADILLATFGDYPTPDEIDRDYQAFIRENIRPHHYWAKPGAPLPDYLLQQTTPSDISALDLNWDRIPCDKTLGFYAGRADDFEDVVNYWNLRACDLALLFLDPSHSERLALLRAAHSEFIQQRQAQKKGHDPSITVWSRSQAVVQQLAFPEDQVPFFSSVEGIDIGRGIVRPPLHYFSGKTVLGSISERYRRRLAFQLPEKPYVVEDDWTLENFVVSVRSFADTGDEANTFWTPYISDLNKWYGRNVCTDSRIARAEVDGIGIICPINADSLDLASVRKEELATKLFELAGIAAAPSLPGRVASRLISQLGGLQGCRVLKIIGVRRLIRKYSPLRDFDRTEAIRIIGNCDPATGQPRLGEYEGLFIEQRDPAITKLKPEHAFLYLLDKGVFRVGLSLVCPNCELPFWVELDSVSTLIICELCGSRFNVTRQLKDRSWTYRRSGLFGREDNQEGSIPVALTLQQLDTQVDPSFNGSLFLTNMLLKPMGADMQPCETDIFIAIPQHDRIEVAVGECKDAGGKIELDDAKKLSAVADAFPTSKFNAFVVFSKTAPFTPEEVENCRAAQRKNGLPRVILLSDRELEPYSAYERTAQQFQISESGATFDQMARITNDVFFAPKPKS